MEKIINIKFDEEELEDIVKKVTENIMKEAKKDSITKLTYEEPNKYILMYLEANEFGIDSESKRVYWGYAYNTLSSESATKFDLKDDFDRKKTEVLKSRGWKGEVFYK